MTGDHMTESIKPPYDVALPKITPEIWESYQDEEFIEDSPPWAWTQAAVDFACEIVRPAVWAEIERLRTRLELETAALEQACAAPVDRPVTVEAARAAHETPQPPSKTQLQGIKEAVDAAATALPVLFTMCSKVGLRAGAMAADEILGSIQWAQKELAHMMTADETKASPQAPIA